MKTYILFEKEFPITAEELAIAWNTDEEFDDLPYLSTVEEPPKTFNGELLQILKDAGPYITAAAAIVVPILKAILAKISNSKKKLPNDGEQQHQFTMEVKDSAEGIFIKISVKKESQKNGPAIID